MKKGLRIVCDTLLAAAVLSAVLFLLLRAAGVQPYVVVSGSMEPEIHVGSICFINAETPYSRIREGDVIAFSQGGMKVTHRVVDVTEEGLETKGDANRHSDGITTTQENYLGKNIGSVPYLGYMMRFLQSRRGIILVLTGMAALILLEILTERNMKEPDIQEDLI